VKLWLVRHAAPLIGEGVCYGQLHVEADRSATQQCACSLAAVLPADLTVYVSGLSRARQLADALIDLRKDLRLTVDARLNEMDFGTWEGVRWNDIPVDEIDQWTRDFAHHRFGGRESTAEVLQRVSRALDDMASASEVVWITHAGVIRAAAYLAQHGDRVIRSAQEWPTDAPAFGAWTTMEI
jgi:alpha-ribazole phosphatase